MPHDDVSLRVRRPPACVARNVDGDLPDAYGVVVPDDADVLQPAQGVGRVPVRARSPRLMRVLGCYGEPGVVICTVRLEDLGGVSNRLGLRQAQLRHEAILEY